MIQHATAKLIDRQNLQYDEAAAVMDEIMSGRTAPVQIAAFLAALAVKGESVEEITACAAGMRAHAQQVPHNLELLEIVGTGGDGAQTLNISTTAALIIAAGGVRVAKHGNRAASSRSGSADCLEALGVNIHQSAERAVELLETIGICFFFAQQYHTAMKHVAPVRREMGVRTVFNILGPLTNPAAASLQVLGVFAESLVEPLAKVLNNLGVQRGMVVYGQDKLDEISLSAPTTVCEFANGIFHTYVIQPQDFGFTPCEKADLAGGTPQENATITWAILSGAKGPKRDAVVINAAAGLYIGGKAATLAEGVMLAAQLIEEGEAMRKLEEFITESNKPEVQS